MVTDSNYQYRIHSDVVRDNVNGTVRKIRVQTRRLGVWIDIKTYSVDSADMADHDYAMLCAKELLEKLESNETLI